MGKRSDWKKLDELSANDLDKGCRGIVDQSKRSRRNLKAILRRQARKRLKGVFYDQAGLDSQAVEP